MAHTGSILTLDTAKVQINQALAEYSNRRSIDAERISPQYVHLRQSIANLLNAGGKRLRPYIVLAIFQAYAPNESLERVIPAAIAQELIHLAMLVHDDIIDRDLIRHGILNVAGSYEQYYEPHISRKDERKHYALSAALLAGDALIADAHQEIRRTNLPHTLVIQAEDILSQSIFEVVGGELLDSEAGFMPKGTVEPLAIAEHKTSSYSFIAPLLTGAVLAEAPDADRVLLRELGKHLGIGFQLRDDLLGTFGDEALTGKSASGDIKEGKRTFMIEEFERLASEEDQATFFAIFHREDVTDDELALARLLLMQSGAEKAVKDRIQQHREVCEKTIATLTIRDASKTILLTLVDSCLASEL